MLYSIDSVSRLATDTFVDGWANVLGVAESLTANYDNRYGNFAQVLGVGTESLVAKQEEKWKEVSGTVEKLIEKEESILIKT